MQCPLCGGTEFIDFRERTAIKCATCQSLPRHRSVWLLLRDYVRPKRDWRVLHIAPELSTARQLMTLCAEGYEPVDFKPKHFERKLGRPVKRFNLVTDSPALPSDHYDLVLHSHVMEHIPADIGPIWKHLTRTIKPGGFHLFALPILRGASGEDLDPAMAPEERRIRFGNKQHMRRFGQSDFHDKFDAELGLPSDYSLTQFFSPEQLRAANIPEAAWPWSAFLARKPERPWNWARKLMGAA